MEDLPVVGMFAVDSLDTIHNTEADAGVEGGGMWQSEV